MLAVPVIVLALLWLTLQWGILPNLHRWREPIEQQASRMLGLPVNIGAIRAQTRGFMPRFELDDVVVHDKGRREALRLARVQASVSPRSLLTFRPHFEQILIQSATLDIRRDTQGRLHVAGIDIGAGAAEAGSAHPADWLFEQREFAVRGATVRWTDEQRAAPPLALEAVDFVVRNGLRRHELRLEATPPQAWGDRFSLRGDFSQPFISGAGFVSASDWRSWSGTLRAELPRADVNQLRRYADLPFRLDAGHGAIHAAVELVRGEPRSATADLALADVAMRWAEDLPPVDIRKLEGRMVVKRSAADTSVALEDFSFTTQDGRSWPRGDMKLALRGPPQAPTGGELEAQRIDLSLLSMMATRLPLSAPQRALVEATQPKGYAERFVATWQGLPDAPTSYRVRASLSGLGLKAQPVALAAKLARQPIGRPGVEGAAVELDATHEGGSASLRIEKGSATFPGILEQPIIPVDQLDAQLRWRFGPVSAATAAADTADAPGAPDAAAPLSVEVTQLSVANADLQGEFRGTWRRGEGALRYPGHIDLDGKLSRGKAGSVARYLPLGLAEPARRYVEQSVLDGRIFEATVKVRGEMRAFPYAHREASSSTREASSSVREAANEGEFRFVAKVDGGRMNIAPQLLASDGSSPVWPLLEQMTGELIFDRSSMQIRRGTARVNGVALADIQGDVDFARPPAVLRLGGVAQGPATRMLGFVHQSPVDVWTSRALSQATATGDAELRLALELPLRELPTSTVRGSLRLAGNDVRMRPDVPLLAQARGTVEFTERGLSLGSGASAMVYGAETAFQGGTRDDGQLQFQAQGSISAEGLAQAAPELGEITRLASMMKGQAPYQLTLGFRAGQPEFVVTSNMVGMAVNLPAPLTKGADEAVPLRISTSLVPPPRGETRSRRDLLRVEAGPAFTAQYLRELGAGAPKVLSGGIGVGVEAHGVDALPQPASGVHAVVKTQALDLDAWRQAAAKLGIFVGGTVPASTSSPNAGTVTATRSADSGDSGYAPRAVALEVQSLRIDARQLSRVTAGLTQEGSDGTWRATLEADQLSGYAQWRPATARLPPRLQARLARLSVPASASDSVEAMLGEEAPERPPALDIIIDDFELRGRKLGRVEIDATHERAGGEALAWRLNKLTVTTPEARLSGTGRWDTGTEGSASHRTLIDFKLELADSGAYLSRFGLPGVIRGGQGAISGQISWAGSPITWHAPSLAGEINLRVDAGQFLKAGPGAARLLGVLNLQSLPRRLLFDFRDVFSEGFAFDTITGDLRIDRGLAITNNVRMRGVQAVVLMEGSADVLRETQDLRVWVVPEINAGTASLAYAAINPAIGLGTFVAQLFLRRPLMEASTREFLVQGSWNDPQVVQQERKQGARMPEFDAESVTPPTTPSTTPPNAPAVPAEPAAAPTAQSASSD